ncbi:FadR family transcriptional regulator [Labedella populi]|uniref:FadR family transcriptional regulator n=1 Tax=Labedella populi TaxID=2498850 RepID=A0A3S3ZM86_9MICO|nr:FCD domain-containing protein [Labedella populi]RWZ58501.1 FadR family transcriptional regulator [Labedella populi]
MDLSSPTLGAIRRTTAVDTVRARIALAVELGMLGPGQRLPAPEDTAVAFDVSAMTVRRAYRALSEEGVLVRRRGNAGGTFIADAPPRGGAADTSTVAAYREDADRVHALIDQRAALEAGLASVAAATRSDADLERLTELTERMRTASDWAGYRSADTAFHERLVAAAGLPAASELHHRISHELYAYFIPYRIDYLRSSNEEHAQLIAALTARDAGAASRLAFDHVADLHGSMYVGLGTH